MRVEVDGKEFHTRVLPKWAREYITTLERLLDMYICRGDRPEAAIQIQGTKDWVVVKPPTDKYITVLWTIEDNRPRPLCSLGRNDVIMIGRGAPNE